MVLRPLLILELLVLTGTIAYADTLDFPGSIPGSTTVVGASANGKIEIGTYQLLTPGGFAPFAQYGFKYEDGIYTQIEPTYWLSTGQAQYGLNVPAWVTITDVNATGDYTGWICDSFIIPAETQGKFCPESTGFTSVFDDSLLSLTTYLWLFHQQIGPIFTKALTINNPGQVYGTFACSNEEDCGQQITGYPVLEGEFLLSGQNTYVNYIYDGGSGCIFDLSLCNQHTEFVRNGNSDTFRVLPEPSTLSLLCASLIAVGAFARKRRRNAGCT
jgi:hypothetical protein